MHDFDDAILATLRRIAKNGHTTNFLLTLLVVFLVVMPAFKPLLQAVGWWNMFGLPE